MLILIKSDYNYGNRIRAKYTALYILVISWRYNIRLLAGASVLVTVTAVTVLTVHMGIRNIEQSSIKR